MYLENIKCPADVKKMTSAQMEKLAAEIREGILNRDSKIGGHVGPNLGIVETTIALHYVFESPKDKIVYDVSHQCYPHKMLTGRQSGFTGGADMADISGYTQPGESEHDHFVVGHTSTSVSLACGLAKARDLKGEKHNVIALIGDGSVSGGEALEGFSNAAVLNSNIILIVNDNEMSIAENHGGLYTNLRLLRETNGAAECNMFKALGFEYYYVADGNNLEAMIDVLQKVKGTNKPTVVHIHTNKGKGYAFAEENKEAWHWKMPFDIQSGAVTVNLPTESYGDITYDFLQERLKKDKDIVVVAAGTPGVFALNAERRQALGVHYVDVGIAEEHAVAMSSALAKGGCKPVFMVMSSFIQRTYDQLSQDLALNNNSAVILVYGGGIYGADATHLGCFDISLISNIPNIVYLAPTCREEYLAMLNWGLEQNQHPVVIRVPGSVKSCGRSIDTRFDRLNVSEVVQKGKEVALLALGDFFDLGLQTAEKLREHGIQATVINPRYMTGLDEELLNRLKADHQIVVTLESGILDGGFGEKVARFYGADEMKVLCFGARKEFTDREPAEQLYKRLHLTPEQIVADILQCRK